MGREENAQHAVLALIPAVRNAREFGLGTLRSDQVDAADFLCHQHAAIGQERDAPGQIEIGHLRDVEGKVRIGFLFACIGLRMGGACQQSHEKGGDCQLRHFMSPRVWVTPVILILWERIGFT
jgi:hypothetical protein